ncbi:MAG: outer membrane beta-barrel protein [Pseudomonadota bacterium]
MRLKLFLIGMLCTSPLFAQVNSPGTAVPPAVVAEQPATDTATQKKFLGLDYSGYIDGSYNYLVRSNHFTSGNNDRVFDLNQNGPTLQQAALTLSHQPASGFGGLVNVILGRDANGAAPLGINPQSLFNSENLGFTSLQAYLQFVHDKFTLMAGQFLTLVGEEQINPTQDSNFSRSILFYSTPDTHFGFRGVYVASDKLTLTAGINDGWNNITDFSRHKTIEFGASCTLNPIFSFSLQGYTGQERATQGTTSGPVGQRTLIDFITTVNATSKLSFAANYDYGWQNTAALPNGNLARAGWQGIAGYANYKVNDTWQGSLRGEVFNDRNGYVTGVRQNWREVTLSVGYTPIKNLEVRAETRHDFSDVNAFVNRNGMTANNNNQSFALEGFYQF